MSAVISEDLKLEIQELSLLLDNRTFVDYFNVFLCLPVFGQNVFYNFIEAEFEFEPPIRNRRHLYLDRREILRWLCAERFRAFKQCPLYSEYQLCMKLRNAVVDLPNLKQSDEAGEDRTTFTRNVVGSVSGMLMFRESLRSTCGENVYRCWKDLEAWRRLSDPVKRMYWKHALRTRYICQGSVAELKTGVKILVFQGKLNFDMVPARDNEGRPVPGKFRCDVIKSVDTEEALLELHGLLLNALIKYWLPRHLLNVLRTTKKETLALLKRPAPGDLEYLDHERRLRCRIMFPTIYRDSPPADRSSATVFESKSANDLPKSRVDSSVMTSRSDEDLLDDGVTHTDLLNLWGGPAKDITIEEPTSPSYSCIVEDYSADELGKRRTMSSQVDSVQHTQHPVSITLTSYLGGKKRTIMGNFPNISNRMIWALASDAFACYPFRSFLERNDQSFDLHYLNFWCDVRNYLDADDSAQDSLGNPLKKTLAQRIANRYLSRHGAASNIFSESLKMALYSALVSSSDVTLLVMAQDIVEESLWEPLKNYMKEERRQFLKQVRGKRYDVKSRKQRNVNDGRKPTTSSAADSTDPMYSFKCNTIGRESVMTGSSNANSPMTAGRTSRPMTSYRIAISEEQMWKALDLAVLCTEYGTPMIVPQHQIRPEDLVDVLCSDYSSLYVSRVPTVRNKFIRGMLEKPKINIEKIKVSRKVILDVVDIDAIRRWEAENPDGESRLRTRTISRRNGVSLDQPPKPKSFMELLHNRTQYEFFKQYMIMHKTCMPLLFWTAVEELKGIKHTRMKQIRVAQIMRKFFGKIAKYGAGLDCHDDIIRQVVNAEKPNPSILICAQGAVFRSMERKWYPCYLDTFPPDSEASSAVASPVTPFPTDIMSTEFQDFAPKKRRKRLRFGSNKTVVMWRNLTKALVEFNKAVHGKHESQLIEIFLRCEVEKERESGPQDPGIEKNIAMSGLATNAQTKVVVKNRLIVLNKLPADFHFWVEVGKYHELVDTALSKARITPQDNELLADKAKSIFACFLSSDVPPRVQINIPNDMAQNIIQTLTKTGPTRGLFHEAVLLLFPLLYHYYRKFTTEWMSGEIPDDYVDTLELALKDRVCCTPHPHYEPPDYTHVELENMRNTQQVMEDNTVKISFSISSGVAFVYPQPKTHRSTNGETRMTHAGSVLNDEISPPYKGGSRMGLNSRLQNVGSKMHVGSRVHLGERPSALKGLDRHKLGDGPTTSSHDQLKSVKSQTKRRMSVEKAKKIAKTSEEKARRISKIVETLTKERAEKESQSKKFNMKTLMDVVSAAVNNENALSDNGSVASN